MGKSTGNLEEISEKISSRFALITEYRDEILKIQRELIRCASLSISALHRGEFDRAYEILKSADGVIEEKRPVFDLCPELYFSGYFLDAQKELAEAHIAYALITGNPLPDPDDLKIEYSAYVNGMGEAIGEIRRYILDKMRSDSFENGEAFLDMMEELYCLLISLDYPDAITRGLRRTADIARSIIEKTRGDLTQNISQKRLARKLDGMALSDRQNSRFSGADD